MKVAPFTGQKGAMPKLKLTCLGVTVEINKSHYDKLRLLYARTAGPIEHDATAFTHAAMALLLRYSSLQGTHYRGGGFQVRPSEQATAEDDMPPLPCKQQSCRHIGKLLT